MSNREVYINGLRSAAVTIAKKNLMKWLLSFAPFLSWGPIAPLVAMGVEFIAKKALDGGEMLLFFKFVDFRVAHQNKQYSEAAMNNYLAQQNGTKEQKDEAEKLLIEAHDNFVKLNNL